MSQPRKIFGTDGVRGTANIEPVTAETALRLGRAAGHVFKNIAPQSRGRGRHKIVIGKDTRLSGYMLENALSSGILSMGVDVLFIGPLPTPGVAYVTRSLRADAGIVITASHNPYDDNGIKFFRADGYKLDDNIESRIDDALGRYIEFVKSSVPRSLTLEGLRVVVDCAHGAAYKSTPCVLRELGADVIVYGDQPDGKNINKDCGSMHPALMCRKIWEHRSDLGIAHDGDADRVLLCDETGRLIDGDDIMAIAGLELLAQGMLAEKTVVSTVMSNAGLEAAITGAGGCVVRTAVGDKNVIDEMLRKGFTFGGEQSGHMIFRDYSTTGDGLVTALQVLRIMRTRNLPLSKLTQCWTRFPQVVSNIVVREKRPFEQLDNVPGLLASAETELKAQGGRVFLRYSGTEPKARLLLEGRDPAALQKWTQKISEAIKQQVGA